MTRFLNAYVALERMAMDADADGDSSFSEVARDHLDAFWSGMSDEERAEMRARVLASCCRCNTSLLVAPPDPGNMMSWSYTCATCSTKSGLYVPAHGHRSFASGGVVTRRSPP